MARSLRDDVPTPAATEDGRGTIPQVLEHLATCRVHLGRRRPATRAEAQQLQAIRRDLEALEARLRHGA